MGGSRRDSGQFSNDLSSRAAISVAESNFANSGRPGPGTSAPSRPQSSHGDDDLPSGVTFFDVPERPWRIAQRVRPINEGNDVTRGRERGERLEVLRRHYGHEATNLLADEGRDDDCFQ